jgi:hypothetical protein
MRTTATLGAVARARSARWLYYGHRLLQRLSGGRAGLYAYLIVAQPIGAQRGPALRDDRRTRVQEVGAHDPLIAAFPRPATINRARFEAGGRCHAVTVDTAFAGHLWVATRAYDEDEVRCRFVLPDQPTCSWDFDVYIDPRFRAGRTMARLWQAVDQRLAAEGFSWTLSRISRLNSASLLAHERLGALPVASVGFFVAGPLQVIVASCAPWLHIGFGRSSRPTLTLPAPPDKVPGPDGAAHQDVPQETAR